MRFRITIALHPNDVKAITSATSSRRRSQDIGRFVRELIDLRAASLLEDRAEEDAPGTITTSVKPERTPPS